MQIIILAIFIASITGCAAVESYKFGDLTRSKFSEHGKLKKLKGEYCSSHNAETRELVLSVIRLTDVDYSGVCDENI